MNPDAFLALGREALMILVIASAPPLLASIGSLVLAGPWIGAHLAQFTQDLFAVLPNLH